MRLWILIHRQICLAWLVFLTRNNIHDHDLLTKDLTLNSWLLFFPFSVLNHRVIKGNLASERNLEVKHSNFLLSMRIFSMRAVFFLTPWCWIPIARLILLGKVALNGAEGPLTCLSELTPGSPLWSHDWMIFILFFYPNLLTLHISLQHLSTSEGTCKSSVDSSYQKCPSLPSAPRAYHKVFVVKIFQL